MLCLTPKVCLFWWLFSPSSSSENVICNHNIKSSNFQVATPSGVLLLYWKCSSSCRFGLSGYVPCLLYTSHVLYHSLLDGELLGFVSHFFLLNASPMFSMCDGWVEKVWQQYLPMLLHTTCFFGTPIIFLPARHGFPKLGPFFLLSLLRKDFLVRWTF